jgi:hypothetical protein
MTRLVTGLFGKRRDVDLVIEHLVQEFGIPRERVQAHALDRTGEEARSPEDSDIGSSVEPGLPEQIMRAYGEGLHRGGILLAAWVDGEHFRRALDVCREYGAEGAAGHDAATSRDDGDATEHIRRRAYHLWEQAGRPEGRDLEFWQQASDAERDRLPV